MIRSSKVLLAYLLLLCSLLVLAVAYSPSLFFQLTLAFALAYILNPAVCYLESRGFNRLFGILFVFALSSAITILFVWFLVISIGNEFSSVQINLPGYIQHLYGLIPNNLKSYFHIETAEKLSQMIDRLLFEARSVAPDLIKPVLLFVQKAFSSSIGFVLSILGYAIIPVYLFYFLADLPQLKFFVFSFVPERFRKMYEQKLLEVDTVLSGFIRGQLLVCAILALLYSFGLYLIGIDLAIAIGMLAGITFIIPYVGTVLGILLSVVMASLKFHDLLHPLLCVGWFALVQGVEGIIITPRVVGDKVGLHPLVALVALLLAGQLFGITGMLLAIPLTAVFQVFLKSLVAYYVSSEFYQGGGA